MSKTKKIAVLAIIAMVLTLLPVQLFAAETQDTTGRIFGAGRVETALEVCKAGWTSANAVVLAPADQANLVDALAAAPLAGQENAPILLTFKDSLDPAVKAKISALGAKKVYVVGAITDAVKNEVAGITGVTVEVLKGESRWETAKAINAKLSSPNGTFVVGYAALADALSVSSYAAANKYAIILADVNGNLSFGQTLLGSKTYLVGGSSLVADINGATRIAGADRFETNKKMLETLGFDFNKVYVANGYNEHLVDSLVAAPLAAKNKAAIVLADNSGVAASSFINGKLTAASQVIALGGTGVVADSVRDSVKYNTPATFAVESIEQVSLYGFKVTFNQAVDEDTAETVSNYKVDGTQLVASNKANLLADGKTVLVMLDPAVLALNQNQKYTVEVRGNTVYNEKKNGSAAGKTVELVAMDIETPTIKSVTAVGNKKVKVVFSEPVDLTATAAQAASWKIDGTNLSSLGFDGTNSAAKDPTGGVVKVSDTVELFFQTALSAGTHTLLVKDGTSGGFLTDKANFIFQESSKEFTVDAVTGNPTIEKVELIGTKLHVTFNRPMYKTPGAVQGTNSALLDTYYVVNDRTAGTGAPSPSLSAAPSFKSGSGDKVVKLPLTTAGIKKGINVVQFDKDIKDAFGNKLSDGTDPIRMSFTYTQDTTKPAVLSVSCVSDTKIRIQFTKDIDKTFAVTVANYKVKKSDGTEIFGSNAAGSVAATVPANTDSDTVELTMPAGTKLDGSNYTLTVKNLRDTSIDGNVMDDYSTTFNGVDDYGPNVTGAIAKGGLTFLGTGGVPVPGTSTNVKIHKAIVYFSEAVDASTVILDNVGYQDWEGYYRSLPSGSSISLDGTGKILTVTFPDAYTICDANPTGLTPAMPADKYAVQAIRVSNVKDKNGNIMQGVAQTADIQTSAALGAAVTAPAIVADSFNLYDDGDDIKVEFEMKQELTDLVAADFEIGATGAAYNGGALPGNTQKVDSGYIVGKKVYLKVTSNVATVRSLGTAAELICNPAPGSQNIAGIAVNPFANQVVYDDQVRPRISGAITTTNVPGAASPVYAGYPAAKITFSENIDVTIAGNYEDDFTFSYNGRGLTVKGVVFDGTGGALTSNNVYYVFDPAEVAGASTLTVKAVADKVSIRDKKDRGPENYNLYVPKQEEKDGYSNIADAMGPKVASVVFSDPAPAVAGMDVGDTITITFSEAVSLPALWGVTAGGAAVPFALTNLITTGGANTIGGFATAYSLGGGGVDNATIQLSADGKTITIALAAGYTYAAGTVPAGVFTPSANIKDASGVAAAGTVTATGSF